MSSCSCSIMKISKAPAMSNKRLDDEKIPDASVEPGLDEFKMMYPVLNKFFS